MRDGVPELTRIGVGDHLMLGGDNMDLALARLLESRLAGGEDRLSAARLSQLTARCRAAKERLLALDAPGAVTVTLLGGGAKLIGGARSVELSRDEVLHLVLDGFLPKVAADAPFAAAARRDRRILAAYPADAAITRHIAAFLAMHAQIAREALGGSGDAEHGTSLPLPDALLLNGGVFRAEALAERLQQVLESWRGKPFAAPPQRRSGCRGGAWRGSLCAGSRWRGAHRRRLGTAATSCSWTMRGSRCAGVHPAARQRQGNEIRLPERSFELRLGQPVSFRLASSVADTEYRPGDLAELGEREFVRLPPLATVVRHPGGNEPQGGAGGGDRRDDRARHPATELRQRRGQRWLLEFQLRGAAAAARHEAPAALPPTTLRRGRAGHRRHLRQPHPGPGTRKCDACAIASSSCWASANSGRWRCCARCATLLLQRAAAAALARARAAMAQPGRFLPAPRPRRCSTNGASGQLCPLLGQGPPTRREPELVGMVDPVATRRGGAAGRLQETLVGEFGPWLEGRASGRAAARRARSRAAATTCCACSLALERLPAEFKIEAGDWLLGQLGASAAGGPGWWALGRLGARQPLYGSAHQVVPPRPGRWLEALLALDWKAIGQAAFAASQIAALTGDRARDLPEALRETVAARLRRRSNASASWISQVRLAVGLDKADRRHAFGEALPPGLTLLS